MQKNNCFRCLFVKSYLLGYVNVLDIGNNGCARIKEDNLKRPSHSCEAVFSG